MNTSDILDRLKLFLNAKSDSELSLKLGKFQNYVYQLKKRNGLDIDLILDNCPDVDFNWLLTGEKNVTKSIAEIDSKGNRIELTSITKVTDPLNLRSPLMDYKTGMENYLNNPTTDTKSETNQQLQETLDKRNTQLAELSERLYELQKLVADYQLRDRKKT